MSEAGLVVEHVEETEKPARLDLAFDIADAGACRKRVKITVPRAEVERFQQKEFKEFIDQATMPGFRPGKTPRKLVEKRFRKEIDTSVKQALLMQSLEQFDAEQKLETLSSPEMDLKDVQIPESGDFSFEFEVEVRPEFALPDYRGMEIKRPTRELAAADIDKGLEGLCQRLATTSRKDGPLAAGDLAVVDVKIADGATKLSETAGMQVRVGPELLFRDGKVANFADQMSGAKAGDARELPLLLSQQLENRSLAGKQVTARFAVREVLQETKPGLDALPKLLNMGDAGEVRDWMRGMLERRQKHEQLDAVRNQVIEQLLAKVTFELPNSLLRKQADNVLRRRVVELGEAGYGEEEIRTQVNRLRQESLGGTAREIRKQFLLDAIAKAEKVDVSEDDIEAEIQDIATQSDESPRKVRQKIERDGLIDSVILNIRDRKTIDKVLALAKIVEVKTAAPAADAAVSIDMDAAGAPAVPADEAAG